MFETDILSASGKTKAEYNPTLLCISCKEFNRQLCYYFNRKECCK